MKKIDTEVFCKKCFHRNFAKFTGKHLCQSLLFNKVAGQKVHLGVPFNEPVQVQKVESIITIAKQQAKREQTHPVYLHVVEKYKNVENVNTQNGYKTSKMGR